MNDQDRHEMLQDDIEKFRDLQGRGGLEATPPAILEIVGGILTAVLVLVWLAAMLWVPDPIDGRAWFAFGMLSLGLFGGPTAAIYWLRRGGAEVILQLIRGVVK